MKKLLSIILTAVLLMSVMPMGLFNITASAETSGYYTYKVSNGEVTITDVHTSISGDITIPSTLDGYPVISIGDWAFAYCTGLTSIEIPNSVASIGDYAFCDCDYLTNISIPDSVTNIGYRAFNDCYNLTSINIPENVTSIGNESFTSCYHLTAINVDAKNNFYCSIDGVLYNKDVTLLLQYPEGKIDNIFSIPNGVTSIGDYAFYSCDHLTNINIPDGVTSIGNSAFNSCGSLISVNIPNSVTSIKQYAFMSSASYNDTNNWVDGVLYIDDCIIEAKTTLSGEYSIRTGTKIIADYAFRDCTRLTSVDIPDSVTSICDYAFYSCTGLESITIPNSVKSIGDSAFGSCTSLTSVNIYDGVTRIGNWVFTGCESLTSINIPNSVTNIGTYAFNNTAYYNNTNNWNDGVLYIDNCLIGANTSGEHTVKKGTTVIGGYAFAESRITSVEIPNSVISIDYGAFIYCDNLKSINIPNSVTSIGDYAFYGCKRLTSIIIPNSVTSIGDYAFDGRYISTIYGFEGSYAQTYAEENDIPFVALREVVSNAVKVQMPAEVIDSAANLSVTAIEPDKVAVNLPEGAEVSAALIYDIYFEKDGEKVQPSGDVTVYIPVSEEMNGDNCKVFFIDDDGNSTDMQAVYKDGYMVFTTNHFSYYAVIEGDFSTKGILGDANGDGAVNISDAVIVARASAGLSVLNETATALSDVTGDGKVNVSDAVLIARYGAGLINTFPAEQ